jgi:hypothetical protein
MAAPSAALSVSGECPQSQQLISCSDCIRVEAYLVISTAHSQGITKSLSAKDLVVQVAILLVLCCILLAVLTGEEQMHSEKVL